MSDLCRLGMRFVRSNLEAFNPALLGPTALIYWIYKPSIINRLGGHSFSTACPPILVRLGVHEVHGVNDKGRERRGHWILWVVPFRRAGRACIDPSDNRIVQVRSDLPASTGPLVLTINSDVCTVDLMPFSLKGQTRYSATTFPEEEAPLELTAGRPHRPQLLKDGSTKVIGVRLARHSFDPSHSDRDMSIESVDGGTSVQFLALLSHMISGSLGNIFGAG